MYKDVDRLRAYCVVFEVAQRDAHGGGNARQAAVAATDVIDDVTDADDVIAAARAVKTHPHSCGNCGGRHQPGQSDMSSGERHLPRMWEAGPLPEGLQK